MLLPYTSYTRKGSKGLGLYNCYAEPASPDSAQPVLLIGSAGLDQWLTHAKTGCRGALEHQGKAYAVVRQRLIRVEASGVTDLGNIPGSARVSMASNGKQLCIVSQPSGWIWETGTLTKITDSTFTAWGASDVTEIDGYFVFTQPGSNLFFASNQYDGLTYDGTDYDLAGKYKDNAVGIFATEVLLIIGCEKNIEFWFNASGSPFVFSRSPNGVAEVGLLAKHSLAKDEIGTYLLAHDNTVRRVPVAGIEPVRISNHGVEEAITGYATKDDAWAFTTTQEGNNFYYLVFPTEGKCWAFNASSNQWNERGSSQRAYWNVAAHTQVGSEEIIFARDSNMIGKLEPDVHTEWDYDLIRTWTYANIYNQGKLIVHRELALEMDTGETNKVDPQVMLKISDDGGKTFRGPRTADGWNNGEYGRRVNFWGLGSAYNRVYQCSVSDDMQVVVRDTQIQADGAKLPSRKAA